VSDMSTAIEAYTISINALGIMGNDYTRTINPEATMNLVPGNTRTTSIGEVTAQLPIGNTIASQFRWKDPASAPSYCSLNHQIENERLQLSCTPPISTPTETHELIIETFDNNSSVKSALRTDKITLNVEAYV